MRLTKEQAETNRQRIIAEAGRLFRERGFEGISVAELMQAAGFTHGGFYNHFASKSDLMAEVTRNVLATATANLTRRTNQKNGSRDEGFIAYIDSYLSHSARDDPGHACPISTLGQDVVRQDAEVKAAFAQGLRTYLAAFAEALPDANADAKRRRSQAIANLAALIGCLVMARAVAGEDEPFSQEILTSVGAIVKNSAGLDGRGDA
jgi:TetR/AcrR family transcriptional regulator, transcriptional repressor for nem operon